MHIGKHWNNTYIKIIINTFVYALTHNSLNNHQFYDYLFLCNGKHLLLSVSALIRKFMLQKCIKLLMNITLLVYSLIYGSPKIS